MNTKSLLDAKAAINEQWGLSNELLVGLSQLKLSQRRKDNDKNYVLQAYVERHFPDLYPIEDAEDAITHMRLVPDDNEKIIAAFGRIIRAKSIESLILETPFTPRLLSESFAATNEKQHNLSYIKDSLKLYGIALTPEIETTLQDDADVQNPPPLGDNETGTHYIGVMPEQVNAAIELAKSALHTHSVRCARHFIVLQLMDKYPEEMLGFDSSETVEDMQLAIGEAINDYKANTQKMIYDIWGKLHPALKIINYELDVKKFPDPKLN